MKIKNKTRDRKWWRDRIDEWSKTGLSIVTFCKQRGINYQTFYKWRSLLKIEQEGLASKSVAIQPSNQLPFVELRPAADPNAALEIESPTGWKIRIHSQMDKAMLGSVISALEKLS